MGTYPPRECGIATFSQDLLTYCKKFLGTHIDCKVAAINLTPLDTYKYPKEVKWKIDRDTKKDYSELATTINADPDITGVVIQHENGIFGGNEGENVLYFMRHCKKPMLVTLHTVLPLPNPKMKVVTEEIIRLASTLVVLTNSSKTIVETMYPKSGGKLFEIPHGIHPTSFSNPKEYKVKLELENHIVLSTFGLLGPDKGIEYVIKSLPEVIKKHPTALYLILGKTHPILRRRDGEQYRNSLSELITKLHLKKHVKFYDQYLSLNDLFEFLKATDIYISTSTNPNQAVSGTLSYALGAGRPVISTKFAQAKEIVKPDMGRLVPIKDSKSITDAILDMLIDDKRLKKMSRTAYQNTRIMLWSHVAEEYIDLLTRTLIPPFKIDHLQKMTNDFGLLQFSSLTIPNQKFGYTLDDNARAIILCSWLIQQDATTELEKLIAIYFKFIKKCQQVDGSFVNYFGANGKYPTAQNNKEDLEDAQSRALWAICEIMQNQKVDSVVRVEAKKLFLRIFNTGFHFTHIRSKAFVIKALALAYDFLPKLQPKLLAVICNYADDLMLSLRNNSHKTWYWFEDQMLYNNGILPESLLIAGSKVKHSKYTEKGLLALQFLISKTFSPSMYRPIGHSAWYKNKQKRSNYDQQPEDPASMISALVCANKITNDDEYKKLAKKCFSWFLGNNTLCLSLYDEKSGG